MIHDYVFAFSIIFRYWDDVGSYNLFPVRERDCASVSQAILVKMGKIGRWCPDSLHRQVTSSHGIDNAE